MNPQNNPKTQYFETFDDILTIRVFLKRSGIVKIIGVSCLFGMGWDARRRSESNR